ncbi:MAG: type II toxin-antitoxin system RelE/ParE family toxin [Candidatus Hydrothermarchaeaceae archaeon]
MYRVELASQPRKFLKKLAGPERERIIRKLDELSETPLYKGARLVEGRREKTYRVRVGSFRILYHVFWADEEVLVSVIDRRPRAYR